MNGSRLVLTFLAALTAAAALAQKPATFDPNAAYDRATSALNEGRYAAAIPDLKALKERYPRDATVRSKLIIAYEGSGDFDARDRERGELIQLHASTDDAQFRKQSGFQRDLFHVAGRPVGALEYFEAAGERPLHYSFLVIPTKPDAKDGRRITLGSSAADTRFAKPRGDVGSNDRLYSLDEEVPGGLTTWDTFRAEPSYEDLKKEVIEILRGRRQPLASFQRKEKN